LALVIFKIRNKFGQIKDNFKSDPAQWTGISKCTINMISHIDKQGASVSIWLGQLPWIHDGNTKNKLLYFFIENGKVIPKYAQNKKHHLFYFRKSKPEYFNGK
jgi:hypothetical protein